MAGRLLVVALLLRLAAEGAAQGAVDAGWGNMTVHGGTAALRKVAGLDAAGPRARAFLDIIRALHVVGEGVDAAADGRRARLTAYLETLSEFERARSTLPPGAVSLRLAENKDTRRRLEDFAEALGSSLKHENRVYRLQPGSGERESRRRASLLAAGLDVAALESRLNAGESVSLSLPSDEVPLPLPRTSWSSLPRASEKLTGTLMGTILGDRRASLLFYGLSAMDEETRRVFAGSSELVREIYESSRTGAFAAFGRSFHVRNGRIDPPGGSSASPLWEELANEKVTRPDRFILKVLGKDNGRLALLYDAIAHLDAGAQRYALGMWYADADQRRGHFRALYAWSEASLAGWDLEARPFARRLYDPAHLLLVTPAMPDGRPGAPGWRRLWEKAFDGDAIPENPPAELKNLEKDGLADAAWAVQLICVADYEIRRDRAEAWLFGHRVFRDATISSMPQVLVALRGYQRFRVLADTLERLGVTDPAVYAAAVQGAQRIAEIGHRERTAKALALYQGALALVERARIARVLDAPGAERLVLTMAQAPLADNGEFLGAVASWIDTHYLPAVSPVNEAPPVPGRVSSAEENVLSAFAGRQTGRGRPPASSEVEIEGLRYRVDPVTSENARLAAVRDRQGGRPLDVVLAFAREARAIATGITDIKQIPGRVSALKSAATALTGRASPGAAPDANAANLAEAVADAVSDLGKIRKPKDLKKAEGIAVPLQRVADAYLAPVLVSLAYAPSLGDPDGRALLAGDPSLSHDWGLAESRAEMRIRNPWRYPTASKEGSRAWHVTGSLLGLDVGLGDQALRRLSTDSLPEPPTILDNDRVALTEAVVLANPFNHRDDDLRVLTDAIRRGRARVAALASVPSLYAGVAEAADLDEWRQQMLSWALTNEREQVPEFFSLADLARIGGLATGSMVNLDAWGTSGLSFDGCLCTRYPVRQPLEVISGRQGKSMVTALVPDLTLFVAEALADRRLPAVLTRWVLAVATQDVIDEVRPSFEGDWMALVTQVRKSLPARMDDYIASITTHGPLVPVQKDGDVVR